MQKIKRVIYIIVILAISLVLALLLYLTSLKPQYSGTIQLQGPKQPVEIIFDSYGIPHIYGKNEEDTYFALGYVHAQDRLFQMEMIRRVASGNLSEIFGKEFIPIDKFFKTLGLDDHAALSAATYLNDTTEHYQRAALAYVKGINQFIAHGRTPVEFTLLGIAKRDFTPADIYLTINYMAFNFAQGFKTDPTLSYIYNKLGNDYLKEVSGQYKKGSMMIPVFIRDSSVAHNYLPSVKYETTADLIEKTENFAAPLCGSNGWVLSGEHSRSGKVLFANDAHIGYAQPSVWYEANLEYPGYSFYGNHLAGFPFAAIGHNKSVSWGLTMLMNDDVDFYTEKVNPANKYQYWEHGKWIPMKVKTKMIKVKNEADRECIVRTTNHGPLVQGVMPEWKYITNEAVACWWTHLKFPSNLLQVTYELNHASTMAQVRTAASEIISPGLNIMYGDSAGNIAWWAAAKLIHRSRQEVPYLLMNGASGKYDPIGFYDFSYNPKSENPPSGIIYSANNQPDSVKGFFLPGYYVPDDRAKRINELLTDRDKYSPEDFQRINFDVISNTAPRNAQNILALLDPKMVNKTPIHNKAYYNLLRWNGDHQPNDISPTIYYRLIYYILKMTLEDEMGTTNFNAYLKTHAYKASLASLLENNNSVWWDDINTKKLKESRYRIFNLAFDQTINDLVKNLDDNVNAWQWGRVHQLEHVHPIGMKQPFNYLFNVGPFPVCGGIETINNADFMLTSLPRYKVTLGPSMRIVLDFANLDNSMSILPTGESGNLMSNYYKDQSSIYNNGKLRAQKMNRKEIFRKKSGRLVLQPAM
ncbi:MAG: penicillin acylase family protein [Bacteroidota bacterium]